MAFAVAPARAQGVDCEQGGAACSGGVSLACLQKLSAGAIPSGASEPCAEQLAAYRGCLEQVALQCSAAGGATGRDPATAARPRYPADARSATLVCTDNLGRSFEIFFRRDMVEVDGPWGYSFSGDYLLTRETPDAIVVASESGITEFRFDRQTGDFSVKNDFQESGVGKCLNG